MMAKILVAAHSTGRSHLMAELVQRLVGSKILILLDLSIGSNEIYSTVTRLHGDTNNRLRTTVAHMRDSFETG